MIIDERNKCQECGSARFKVVKDKKGNKTKYCIHDEKCKKYIKIPK